MAFIRPETQRYLIRWREVIVCSILLLIGVQFLSRGIVNNNLLAIIFGLGLSLICAVLIYLAVIRISLLPTGPGPGIIHIKEREIIYMGPETGGTASLDDLWRIDVETSGHTPHGAEITWQLISRSADLVEIPHAALGIETMLDALAALPGFRYDRLARVMKTDTPGKDTVWQRPTHTNAVSKA